MTDLVLLFIGAMAGALVVGMVTANTRSRLTDAITDREFYREQWLEATRAPQIPLGQIQSELADCQDIDIASASLACEFFRAFPDRARALGHYPADPGNLADQDAVSKVLPA